MQPEEAIQFAQRLLDDPNAPEIDCRAAARSAYYGVYHLVCGHFGMDPYNNYSEARHEMIRARLRRLNPATSPPEIREARRIFEKLFDLRVRADYDWNRLFESGDAEDAVEWAKGVFARIQRTAAVIPKSSGIAAPPPKA